MFVSIAAESILTAESCRNMFTSTRIPKNATDIIEELARKRRRLCEFPATSA